MRSRVITVAILLTLLALSCTGTPEPRQTVLDFIESLQQDSTSIEYLEQLLDFDELIYESSIYTYDTSVSKSKNSDDFAALLLKGGKIRDRWLSNQIIIGSVQISGDTAIVEVSFINREARPVKQYYNKMGVHRIDEEWRIFAFKLF